MSDYPQLPFSRVDHRVEDQDTDADTDTRKGVLYDREMRKVLDKCRDDRDNDQGREYNAQSRDDTANGAGKSCPTKVAVFTAIMPGVHWRSRNSP